MAARQAPQLRLFRNDFAPRGASLAMRLTGTKSNRDAIGARVTVETDRCAARRSCRPAPGFSRSTRRSCCSAWGRAARREADGRWPSGEDAGLHGRAAEPSPASGRRRRAREGEPFRLRARAPRPATADDSRPAVPAGAPGSTSRSRRRTSRSPISTGRRSLAALRGAGAAAVLVDGTPGARAVDALAADATRPRGVRRWRLRSIRRRTPKVRALSRPGAGGRSPNRPELRDPPPPPVHEPAGPAAADGLPARRRGRSRQGLSTHRRRAVVRRTRRIECRRPSGSRERCRSPGTFYRRRHRNYSCLRARAAGSRARRAAIVAFERAAQANPSASRSTASARSARRAARPARARGLRARARAAARLSPRRTTISARCSRRAADLERPIARFRARSPSTPDYPGRAQQPRLRAAADRATRPKRARSTKRRSRCSPTFPKR